MLTIHDISSIAISLGILFVKGGLDNVILLYKRYQKSDFGIRGFRKYIFVLELRRYIKSIFVLGAQKFAPQTDPKENIISFRICRQAHT